MKLSILILVLMFGTFAHAETVTGEVFEQKTNFGKKLFDMVINVDTKENGLTETSAIYKDLQGKVAVEEKGQMKGDALIQFDVDERQTGEKGSISVKEDQVLFVYEKDGKKKTAQEKLKGFILTPANFNAYVSSHWSEISSGKEVEVRFGVWFRLETVGFKIFKTGESEKNGEKIIKLRMKPSSFVIAALVDPLDLTYTADGKKLVELSGRVSPKIEKHGSWKDLDADVRYTHGK